MIEKNKVRVNRAVAIVLAFVMLTYQMQFGLPIVIAQGEEETDEFTLQIVNDGTAVEGMTVKGNLDENPIGEPRQTDVNGEVVFPEITQEVLQGNNVITFTVEIETEEEIVEQSFTLDRSQGISTTYKYDVSTEEGGFVDPVTDPGEEEPEPEPEPEPVYYQVSVISSETSSGTGTIKLNGNVYENPVDVLEDETVTIDVTAGENTKINSIKINGANQDVTGNEYSGEITITNDTVIEVEFLKYYTITFSSNGNGKITDEDGNEVSGEEGSITVEHNESTSFTATPNTGYHIAEIKVDENKLDLSELSRGDSYTHQLEQVQKDIHVEITFAKNTYKITVDPTEHGEVQVSKTEVEHGGPVLITLTPDEAYELKSLIVGENEIPLENIEVHDEGHYTYQVLLITSDIRIRAEFQEIPSNSEPEPWESFVSINTEDRLLDLSTDAKNVYVFGKDTTVTLTPVDPYTRIWHYGWEKKRNVYGNTDFDYLILRGPKLNSGVVAHLDKDLHIIFDTKAPEMKNVQLQGENEYERDGKKWYSGGVTVTGDIDNPNQNYKGTSYATDIEAVYYVKGKFNSPIAKAQTATRDGNTFSFPVPDEHYEGEYTVWAVDEAGNYNLQYVEVNVDQTNPSLIDGQAVKFEKVNDGGLNGFINFLTFGTFAKEAIKATVEVEDTGSGIKSIELIPNGDKSPTIEEGEIKKKGKKAEQTFTIKTSSYNGSFSVKVTDNTNHTETYLVTIDNSNIKANNSGVIMIEEVRPEGTITLSQSPTYVEKDTGKKYFHQDVDYNISVGDVDSGLFEVVVNVNDREEIKQSFKDNAEKTTDAFYTLNTSDLSSDDGEYDVEVVVTDNAGNISTMNEIVYVDKMSPVINGILLETADDGTPIDTEEALEQFVELTEYGYYFKEQLRVTVVAADEQGDNDSISGVKSMVIYLKDHADNKYYAVDQDGKLAEIEESEIDQITPIVTDGEFQFLTPESFKGQIIAKAIDNVENIGEFESIRGTIIESPSQHELEEHIELVRDSEPTGVDINGKDLYNGDVEVELTVTDTYSGIKSIEWYVEAPFSTEHNENGSLTINNDGSYRKNSDTRGWEKTVTDHNLVTEMKKTFTVKHNSNDIVIYVKMTDRAGNESIEELTFSIDKTKPVIDIEFDNYDSDEENGHIYPEARVATITITERNFNPEDVLVEITNAYGGEVPAVSEWVTNLPEEGVNPDETTHVATINFEKDGDYTFSISYTDNAGNEAPPVDPDQFIIDGTAPEVIVEYDNNDAANGYYYKEVRIATIEVREINFDENRFRIIDTIPAKKNFPALSEWVEVEPGIHQATIAFTEDDYYEYDIEVSDKAGNELEDGAFELQQFYIDKTAAYLKDGDDDNEYAITFEQKNDGFFAKLMNRVTFGTFFNKKVEITVDAKDDTSGIESIEFVSSGGEVNERVEFPVDEANLTASAEYTLDVDSFDDSFQVTLKDLAHNEATYDVTHENSNIVSETNHNIVVEKEKPELEINVKHDDDVSSYKNWYNGDVTFEIHATDMQSGVATVKNEVNDHTDNYDYTELAEMTTNKVYNINTKDVDINSDGSYDVSVEVYDNAGNKETITHEIFIDETEPEITNFEFALSGKGFKPVDEADKLSSSIELKEYGYYFKERMQVRVSAEDPKVVNQFKSDLKSITVYLQDYENGKYYAVLKDGSVKEIKKSNIGTITPIETKDHVVFTVPRSFKGQIFAQATDFVENTSDFYTPDGTIVESPQQHAKETHIEFDRLEAPFKDNNGMDLYPSNVNVDLTVTDTYSGISEIEWSVVSPYDTDNNQRGSLKLNNDRTYAEGSQTQGWKQTKTDKNLVTEMKKTITVTNDSNDIVVKVKMTDRSGNTSEEEITFSIDKTAPTINVVYDNNSPDPENADYYNADRTATITITERNFDPKDVEHLITNTDGTIPTLNGWTSQINRNNPDLSTHTATISYTADGDYTFDIAFKDMAQNKAAPYDQDSFTIDKTKPVIQVSYDNNNPVNGNYFNTTRTATISVTEHNFDPSRIVIDGSATDGGNAVDFPAISGWSSNGDVHTATISYQRDALYSFDIDYTDMAGNVADDFEAQEFYVDLTEPELSITGVEDMSANNGKVAPVITYSDTNFDANGVTIELEAANRGSVELEGSFSNITNGQEFTFDNFKKLKEYDDLYTLTATVVDLAGNEISEEIRFSVNRFGSVYVFDESLEEIVDKFIQEERDIIITETNVDSLIDGSITIKMTHNGSPSDLVEGEDYTVTETSGEGSWSQYTYTIHKELFAGDGRYTIAIYSEDKAGNINENIDEAKQAEISFGIDKTSPVIVPIDIEEGKQYAVDVKTATVSVKDNLVLADVKIQVNDEEVEYTVEGDNYIFDINNSNSTQDITITATDAAGNEMTTDVKEVLVTTNLLVRWYNNKPVFIGSLGGIGVLALATAAYFVYRRKDKVTEEDILEDKVG
ncbi:InlB B-repeat-containing protein [Ornithinibacillus halotolerans]|uniref:Ig-like domain-containing protein n=1 Tax=Ornithinibacillus halotolerans TaxID=1274357 RepID=A0A916S359_9BACI|nr:Ig-like domain repeat protein [Ornithinibacillus halotolerans]GGA79649.1 hypothetical protein GCM10008025_23810 [Ornithinibacillus halotolerans]